MSPRTIRIAKATMISSHGNRLSRACRIFVVLSISLAWPAKSAVRQPLGVYVHINVNDAIALYPGKKPTAAQLHSFLQGLYADVLADSAFSGIALGAHWDQTQPNSGNLPSSYDWSYIDDAFTAANAANKTIQLIITPGVNSPSLLSARCCSGYPVNVTEPQSAGALSVLKSGSHEGSEAKSHEGELTPGVMIS